MLARDFLFASLTTRIEKYKDNCRTRMQTELTPYMARDVIRVVLQYTNQIVIFGDWTDKFTMLLDDNSLFFSWPSLSSFIKTAHFMIGLVAGVPRAQLVTPEKTIAFDQPLPTESLAVTVDHHCFCCVISYQAHVLYVGATDEDKHSVYHKPRDIEHDAYHARSKPNRKIFELRRLQDADAVTLYPDNYTIGDSVHSHPIPAPLRFIKLTQGNQLYGVAGDHRLYHLNFNRFMMTRDCTTFQPQWLLVSVLLPGNNESITDYYAVLYLNDKKDAILLILVNGHLYGQVLVNHEKRIVGNTQVMNGSEQVTFDKESLIAENVLVICGCECGVIIHKEIGFTNYSPSVITSFCDAKSICFMT